MCLLIGTGSQVSDFAHEPLVSRLMGRQYMLYTLTQVVVGDRITLGTCCRPKAYIVADIGIFFPG